MSRTFIIAEAGINHKGSIDLAKQLIEKAKEAECDAIKFQTYQTDKRVSKDNPAYDILKQCELSYDAQTQLKLYADLVGIEWFSTPFDLDSVEFLIGYLGLRRIKIASFDVANKNFLMEINKYATRNQNINVILSTGMSNSSSINTAISCMPQVRYLDLLHCVSSYPIPKEKDFNLQAIRTLYAFNRPGMRIGYSDHSQSNDILASSLSVLVGAQIVERHFTLDINNGAVDNPVSSDPQSMKQLVEIIRLHEDLLGDGKLGIKEVEKQSLLFRRTS